MSLGHSSSIRRATVGAAEGAARNETPVRRRERGRPPRSILLAALVAVVAVLALPSVAQADFSIDLVVRDIESSAPINDFTYLISKNNAARRTDPVSERPGVRPTPSYIPPVAAGNNGSATGISLPDGRYLVTVKAPGYKLWGKHFETGDAGEVVVEMKAHPLPLGKLVVHAFHDRRSVNAAPDFVGGADGGGEPGLEGFEVRLHDTVGEVQADYNGDPLCGGVCLTDADGNVTIPNLAPGRYEIEVLPPDGEDWLQTTTFEGTHLIDFARVTENDDGLGAIGEAAVAPGVRTTWWFGFLRPLELPACTGAACGSVEGTAKTWVGWPPFDQVFFGDPVKQAVVALSDTGGTEEQVYTAPANPDGSFTIGDIPDGTYTLSIFDENLDFIMRYVTFTLPDPVTGSRELDLNVEDVKGESGVPVARWFGSLAGYVFQDNGLDAAGDPIPGAEADNGIRDCVEGRCEEGIDGIDLDLRWRDGSVKSATFTGGHPETGEPGYYEYPELLSPLAKFLIGEVGFGRFARTGISMHDEFDPSSVSPLPTGLGGGLLINQLTTEGHESWVDWGKREYALDDESTPEYDGEHGGITGIVFHATTRNEFDPALAGAEDYEPGIPDATVKLWGPGEDGDWDTEDDVLVNEVATDAWSHPRSDHPDEPQSCDVRDAFGDPLPAFTPDIAPNCTEFPALSNETKDGAFDGGYAIETMLRHPITGEPTPSEPLLPPRDYVVEVEPPPFYQVIKEEDQNTDEGDEFVPQIPPPPCVGDDHLVNDSRNPADGQHTPLCNKKLVTLEDGQNPAADFFLFTDHDEDPTTNTSFDDPATPDTNEDVSWNTVESVAPPGRIYGFVGDDLRFDTNANSPWYGQPLALTNIPIGVYDYTGRLIKMLHTDTHGFYDVVLPSTQTYDCPTPAGVCPGTYVLRIDDPADPAFNPDYLTAALAFDVWPGKTTYADTPVDPISALSCNLGTVPDPAPGEFVGYQFPEFWRIGPNPYVRANLGATGPRELTIDGAGFGASRGTGAVILEGGPALPASAYLSWSDREIRIRIPQNYPPGPRQLLIRASNGETTPNGITLHVFGAAGSSYTIPEGQIHHVGAGQEFTTIQAALNASTNNDMVVVHTGTYNENVIVSRRIKLQGVGPGGSIGAPESGTGAGIDDIRVSVPGSAIDGRNFFDRVAAWNATLDAIPSIAGNQNVPGGADITVVARTNTQFTEGRNAAIDGLGITMGQGGGAGGIQVNARANRLQLTNNILENNGGQWGGAIALGLPTEYPNQSEFNPATLDNQNDDVRIAYNRILGNGGRFKAGGVAIFNGAERYTVENNDICANNSVEYGGGISHYGLSGGQTTTNGPGRIRLNRIYGNDAFDSGGGIMIAGEYPPGLGAPTTALGSGRVDVERNYISSNLSNDDGGGIMLLDTLGTPAVVPPFGPSRVQITNNMITNNLATDVGGGVTIDDARNVTFVNNTVARNGSTDTSEDRNGAPNGAGFVSEQNTAGGFSDPVGFFNNIFWDNEAFTWDGTALVSAGMIDLEVYGTPGMLRPRYSVLTNNTNIAPHFSNVVGQDPDFVLVYDSQIDAGPSRFFPGEFQTTLFRNDPPPPGQDGLPGDYHITAPSPARNAGVSACSALIGCPPPLTLAPLIDIDGDARLVPPTPLRYDAGADEFRP